ncbi:MAG: TIGR03790 family protein, partial [Chthoniobacterales bacterium]
ATSIRFVALMKGIPLKIRAVSAPYPGDVPSAGPVSTRTEASVDSELAVLGLFSPQISGAVPATYFQSYRPILNFDNAATLLVCRLDAPSAATVRRMITDSVETERNGLWGRAFVDAAQNKSGGLEIGDHWLAEITAQLHKTGVPVIYDDAPETFPDGYPITDCALYYGWYSPNVNGAFASPTFRFRPGAVAVHIHSYSAATLRDPDAHWVGPLLTRGAAASVGNVYEPYLQLTTHLDILNDRLLHGFTLAESAYMATQAVSWMTVIVGDPLYRPYASWLQLERTPEAARLSSDWKMYHEFAVKDAGRAVPEFRAAARQIAWRGRNAPMLEDLGLAEARDGNFSKATSCFGEARTLYSTRDDILRVVLEEANAWIKQGRTKRALDLLRGVNRIVADAPSAPLLKKIETQAKSALAGATPGTRRP